MSGLPRPLVLSAAAFAMVIVSAAIMAAGRAMQPAPAPVAAVEPAPPVPETAPPASQTTAAITPSHQTGAAARAVAPAIVAPPSLQPEELQRVEPRGALGKLGLALPPKPKMPDEWDGSTLYRPVVVAAGLIEAQGYTVAIAGVDAVAADESCEHAGKAWPCGVFARAAFRSFLRGRAINCVIPPEADRTAIVASCRLGKQDVGLWLAANGWARAVAGGPYGEAGETADRDKKGIFGPPPDTEAPPAPTAESHLPAPPDATVSPLAPPESILPPATDFPPAPPAAVAPVTPSVDL